MESYIVRLSSKGQLTLPAGIRRKLGIEKGARLFVALDGDEIRIRELERAQVPVFTRKSGFLRLIGSFEGPEDLAEHHDRYAAEGP